MKITFILPCLDMAGGVISTIELSNRLNSERHEVSIVYPKVLVGPRSRWRNVRTIWNSLRKNKEMEEKLSKRITVECDLIHVPTLNGRYIPDGDVVIATWWETAYYVRSYSNKKGSKFYFVRGYEIWSGNKPLIDKTYSFPLELITTSSHLKKLLANQFGANVIGIVPNGVNSDLFYKAERKQVSGSRETKRIGMVYRGTKLKGMHDGFEAFEIAKKDHPDIKLVLFGGPMGDDIPPHCEFHEYPPIEKLRELYSSLDIFMLPSHEEEGFSNPPMEAMACGVACVVTNVGGVPDYTIPGKTALISPPRDPKALADNLLILLNDDEKRAHIADSGHNFIKEFSWEKSASKLEKILESKLEREVNISK